MAHVFAMRSISSEVMKRVELLAWMATAQLAVRRMMEGVSDSEQTLPKILETPYLAIIATACFMYIKIRVAHLCW